MNPPSAVRVTSALMFMSLVIGIVILYTLPAPPTPAGSPFAGSSIMSFVRVGAIAVAVIEAVIVVFYMQGHNWARWLVMADSVFQFFSLIRVAKTWQTSHLSAVFTLLNVLFAIYLLWYLNTVEAKRYFMRDSPDYTTPPMV